MKSLILKDLYNIGHNAKSMLLILLVFAIGLIMVSGVESYIISDRYQIKSYTLFIIKVLIKF